MANIDIERVGGYGILNEQDLRDFSVAEVRVANLLSDGKWHNADEICLAAGKNGIPAREGLRRFRSVRAELETKGYVFDVRRAGDGRNFLYLMQPPPKATLF